MKIKKFRGDPTDISAKKEALVIGKFETKFSNFLAMLMFWSTYVSCSGNVAVTLGNAAEGRIVLQLISAFIIGKVIQKTNNNTNTFEHLL